ncbi:MAG: hypothetical protein AAFS10_13135, partial [Myxococcota bacterium]
MTNHSPSRRFATTMPTTPHVMLLLALAALTSSNACRCSSTPTPSTPSETTSSAPTPTPATTTPTTPSETTSSPSPPTDSDCRRLTWLGGQEGDRTQEVKLKLAQEQRQVLLTWAGGSMRLTRSPKDLRAFAGPWTADT